LNWTTKHGNNKTSHHHGYKKQVHTMVTMTMATTTQQGIQQGSMATTKQVNKAKKFTFN
jgi:hypothetical protein